MTVIKKILRTGWLLGLALGIGQTPLLSQAQQAPDLVLLAQEQTPQDQTQPEQTPSTSDLEAQPNTNRYPMVRRRRGMPNLTTQDPTQRPDPPDPAPTNNAINPGTVNTAPQATAQSMPVSSPAANNVIPAAQNTAPSNQTLIGPPAPEKPTPEQMPPARPRVTYRNGILTVTSMNARLSDILSAIRARTGIQFEGISSASDRVAGKFGPGTVHQVLNSLFEGAHFDYVIMARPENPSVVQKVILNPNSNATPAAASNSSMPADDGANDAAADDANEDAGADTSEQQTVPGQPVGTPSAAPKTAEQLLQELRQMQQEQEQQQNPNPPSRGAIPIPHN